MGKVCSEVPGTRLGLAWRLLVSCSRTASLVKSAGNLQSVSEHSTYTNQRWTTGAAQHCLPCEVCGLSLQIAAELERTE